MQFHLTPTVFFDMDGVLIDSEPVWQEAIDQVFGGLGITLDSVLKVQTAGMGNAESVRLVLAGHPDVNADVREVCQQIDQVVLCRIGQGVGVIPGADALLRELAARGVPLALVSTSAPALMAAVLQANHWDGLFRVVLSSEDVGPGKPDPTVYREAICRMQADVTQSLAVEDTLNGARSAHGAGLRVIGFTRDPAVAAALRTFVWKIAADYTAIRGLIVI